MSSKRILLVEGEADRGFFEALSRRLAVQLETVNIGTPKSVGKKDTKQGVLHALPTYVQQLADGQIEHLAVVLDADSAASGGLGFAKTLAQLTAVLTPLGFTHDSTASPGLLFNHSNGLNPFGAWIMPNNAADGMLEDWVKSCIAPAESALLGHAQSSIAAIPGGPKFKPVHQTKAEVATWLAWQAKPDHGLHKVAEEAGLLDEAAQPFVDLCAWLKRIFP
ncbi:DUF3226 domain-containing protein [Limnohabitans sp.]|uniref:DUF3226 domain-containing protein n=1 Tax=Limnohabitans sp. TaxID=1907725 RepID=UPI00311EDF9C